MLTAQLLVQGLITASFYALAGVTWGIIYRTTLTFHFSHQLVFTIAGYSGTPDADPKSQVELTKQARDMGRQMAEILTAGS